MNLHTSYLPSWVDEAHTEHFYLDADGHKQENRWICVRPKMNNWTEIGNGLTRARQQLQTLPIAYIIETIGHVAQQWLEKDFPPRLETIHHVSRSTLFSPEAVAESFDVELRNYLPNALWAVLKRELGNPYLLDDLQQDEHLQGQSIAFGPEALLTISTGNVPGLPALSIIRALLVKSPVISKVASGEPCFAAAFARTLAAADPILADNIVCTYWQRDEIAYFDAVLAQVDTVLAYGSDKACARIKQRVKPQQRYIEHGHKISVGIVDEDYIKQIGQQALAQAIARDTSVFNQQACIAPQMYFVCAPKEQVTALAKATANALRDYSEKVPTGDIAADEAASLQLKRAQLSWHAAENDQALLWQADKGKSTEWTVALSEHLSMDIGGYRRFMTFIPATSIEDVIKQLSPISHHFQNIALGYRQPKLFEVAKTFATLGASRICQPGKMVDPSMMWRHDGRMCVAELLRWCDIEMHEELMA